MQRRRHRLGDVLRPAFGRGRVSRFANHLALGVDDSRLDLRPTQIDAASQIRHARQYDGPKRPLLSGDGTKYPIWEDKSARRGVGSLLFDP
jgi:hypothetical protein